MPLTGKDVWEAIVKLGLMSGPYEPRTNRYCANAEKIAALLNEVLSKRQSWLTNLVETEDAMREWEANTPSLSTHSARPPQIETRAAMSAVLYRVPNHSRRRRSARERSSSTAR